MKQQWKWAGLAVALVLVACGGAKYWPALWSTQFTLRDAQTLERVSVVRELADGSVQVAYQRDLQSVVVDTYDAAGSLLRQDVFDYAPNYDRRDGVPPLFASDDVLYFFGNDPANSVKIDLVAQTASPLSALLDLELAEGDIFRIAGAVILDNGQLVLAGGDQRITNLSFRQARVAVLAADGTAQTTVLPALDTFSNLIARAGTNQYFVQSFAPDLSIPSTNATTFLGQGVNLVAQPQISQGMLKLADLSGALAVTGFAGGLFHYDANLQPDWQQDDVTPAAVVATPDRAYLITSSFGSNDAKLTKLDSQGATLWEKKIPANALSNVSPVVSERDGSILFAEERHRYVRGARKQAGDPPWFQYITTVDIGVKYWLLDAAGKELARFQETEYHAVLQRDLTTGNLGTALEYRAGSCGQDRLLPLSSGDFVAVTDWCTDNSFYKKQKSLSYFQLQQ
ncbi:MAG TPA: hypothetical protein VM553_08185 [Dongiaceae bacterium]|nr:hypothetical protein [Dongiaceae bacterium]